MLITNPCQKRGTGMDLSAYVYKVLQITFGNMQVVVLPSHVPGWY